MSDVPASPLLVLRDVGLTYQRRGAPDHTVLAGIDLSISQNEIVCLVGGSGCGKTTLLNVIAGLISPTAGTLEMAGGPVMGPGADRVVVFQDDAVFPWYSVRRNVEYGLRLAGVPAAQRKQRVDDAISLVGLRGFEEHRPQMLSGGMRKRCDLARAIVMNPQLLLMDEPFAALDVMTKERLQGEFLKLCQDRHLTSVFVTHDLEEALLLGDRVAVMGRHGTPFDRIVTIPFERPRSAELRTNPRFQELRFELADSIGRGGTPNDPVR